VVGLGLEKESTGAGAGAGASEPGELERELAHYGYQVILFPELAELAAFLEKHERAAQILLVPLELYESDKAVANFIDNRLRFASPGPGPAWGAGSSVSLDDTPISPFPSPSPSPFLPPPLPVAGTVGVGGSPALIFISERNDATARLQAVRAGGEAFISRPINLTELVAQMDALTPPVMPSAYRILIVDDSPTAAAFYATTLQMAGMVTVTCRNSQQLLDALVEFGPDLILLDIYMPDCNGLEVAAMLRQLPGYVAIPIVFLTAETALDIQLKALQLGSDDFLTKPIHSEHLISLVRSRIERSRLLRSLMERDSLTDLLNHSSFKEQLTIELARATRHNTALVVAILDIDYFKLVNDRYGHLVGDQVLKSLARLLRGGLRQTDAAGRVGGEEFAVVL
jgi:DNA-binding response OmpR family regulator